MLEIYSTDTDAGVITVVQDDGDGQFTVIDQISVGNAPRGAVRFTSDGRGFVSNCGGNTISEIDAWSHREVARITVGIAPRGIGLVPGGKYAIVSNSGSDSISVVDLSRRRELYQFAVGRDPRHMAVSPDGRAAYVAVWGSHYIACIDKSSLVQDDGTSSREDVGEAARIHVGEGAHPYSVGLHPSGELLYTANTQAGYVSVIDTTERRVIQEIQVGSIGGRGLAFSPDGQYGFLTVENTAEVVVIDAKAQEIVGRIPVGTGPRGIALLRDDPLTIVAARFPRAEFGGRAGEIAFNLNGLTIAEFGDSQRLRGERAPKYAEVIVGKGPCSVSVLDTDRLLEKEHASRDMLTHA